MLYPFPGCRDAAPYHAIQNATSSEPRHRQIDAECSVIQNTAIYNRVESIIYCVSFEPVILLHISDTLPVNQSQNSWTVDPAFPGVLSSPLLSPEGWSGGRESAGADSAALAGAGLTSTGSTPTVGDAAAVVAGEGGRV